jgi:hypothetical protein
VVTEIDIEIAGSDSSKRRDNVVLPAPDGDDITKSSPRLEIWTEGDEVAAMSKTESLYSIF